MTLHCGDCLAVMRAMEPESVDAIVCDPPAGIFFMSKSWDHHKGGRDAWIAWLAEVMREGLRLLKPGGHALVWALPRTSHWTGMALEDAGFEVRDRISHLFGSGFPKSLDVGKAMDKVSPRSGMFDAFARHFAERRNMSGLSQKQIAGHFPSKTGGLTGCVWNWENGANVPTREQWGILQPMLGLSDEWTPLIERVEAEREVIGKYDGDMGGLGGLRLGNGGGNVTRSATDLAKQWDGWGTALKPGAEDWWLCRKPLTGTVAQTVSEWGTGAINVDGCRIEGAGAYTNHTAKVGKEPGWHGKHTGEVTQHSGRWPANVVLSHTPECREVGTRKVKGQAPGSFQREMTSRGYEGGGLGQRRADDHDPTAIEKPGYADADGTETVTAWECHESCPVRMLDEQSGSLTSGANPTKRGSDKFRTAYGDFEGQRECVANRGKDVGGASRFFYCAKSSRSEREAGLDGADRKAKLWSSGTQNPGSFQAEGTDRTSTNHHPCVKPLQLMRWLTRLVTPPNGVILDPFAGSFSTGCAAILEGFRFIGIEQDAEYCEIGRRRMAYWQNQRDNVPPSLWDVA